MQKPVPNKKTELDSDRIGRLLYKMSLPVFIGMFVQSPITWSTRYLSDIS